MSALSIGLLAYIGLCLHLRTFLLPLFPAIVVGAILFAMLPSASAVHFVRSQRALLLKDPTNPALGQHTLEVADDWLTESCRYHRLSTRWELVRSIVLTDAHVFLVMHHFGGIIIPKGAFKTHDEQEQFLTRVEQLILEARPRSPKPWH